MERFYMKEPTSSAVVNLEFNEDNLLAKATRKNNINGHRYNIVFAYGNPTANRPYKSVSNNSKILTKDQLKEGEEVVIEINDDKGIRLVSSSLKKHESTPASRQGETSVIMKDPNKKMMLSYKHKPFDLTFTNFKQKIY
jgi:hypothetical protein